uniref:Reverse transcriptase domain-containing protein n=1 Tax=Xenopus tropicalis TaxID=8364 RepID=A0A803JUF4_XENTR
MTVPPIPYPTVTCYTNLTLEGNIGVPLSRNDSDLITAKHLDVEGDARSLRSSSNVINLSSRSLSLDESNLLSKGLNFIPDEKLDIFSIILDLNKFIRLLTVKRHFANQDNMKASGVHNNVDMADSLSQESLGVGQSLIDVSEGTGMQVALDDFRDFCALSDLQDLEAEGSISSGEYPHKLVTVSGMKKNSEFYPIQAKSQQLIMFHKLVQNDIEALGSNLGKNKSKYGNLTPGEYKALHALSRDDTIIIKKADKGGSVVVLDTPAYVAEVMRQLTDVETYTLLKRDPTEGFKSVLADLLSEGFSNGVLTTKEVEMLKCENPVFHVLPKVHKSLDNVKGRPIVASIGSLSENLSCYIDRLLRPLVESLPSYIRDTTMCINQIQHLKWKPSYRWFTMDVVSLYSSIDHSLGLQAIGYWLDKERIFPKAQSDFILQAVDFLLKSNYFLFDGKFYLQRCGAAMGASFAPTYANLFMGWFERLYIFGDQNPFRSRIFSFFSLYR